MKIYTSTFDLAHPSNCRFWVAPHSDFKIGVKIINKGEDYAGAFSMKANGVTFTPDADKTAGFTTFTMKSIEPGGTVYEIDVPGAAQKFYLMQVVTTSTVFEVGNLSGGGGDVPADVATQSWVNAQISSFITEDALEGYATTSSLTAYATKTDLATKADTSALTAYATKADIENKADTSALTAYATKADIENKADTSALTAYATKSELDAKADTSALTAYATTSSLTAYATKADIENKADTSALTAYATKTDLDAKADASALTAYATKEYVTEQGYLTAVPSTYVTYNDTKNSLSNDGYATQSWVSAQISAPELPANLSAETLQIKNANYTVLSAGTGDQNDSATLLVNGTAAKVRIGTAQTTGSIRLNSNGTTPSIEGGKGAGTEAAYSLSCDVSGHGILALNTTTLNASELQSMKDLSGNVYAKADTLSSSAYGTAPKTTSIQTVYEAAWATLSASADANTFYVVLPDPS